MMPRRNKIIDVPVASESPALLGQRAPDRAKILLVDDTPENLISLEAALEGLGQDLVLAQSGMQALRHLLEDDFDLRPARLSKMPDMDGFQTAELIPFPQTIAQHAHILFLTGYKSDETGLFAGYDLPAPWIICSSRISSGNSPLQSPRLRRN